MPSVVNDWRTNHAGWVKFPGPLGWRYVPRKGPDARIWRGVRRSMGLPGRVLLLKGTVKFGRKRALSMQDRLRGCLRGIGWSCDHVSIGRISWGVTISWKCNPKLWSMPGCNYRDPSVPEARRIRLTQAWNETNVANGLPERARPSPLQ